ncbi:MAG: cupin domain-containing protein [Gammaproteobacteria bacterium]|nr:cupin domain-containing protein [Gammaproteobacteria bacterium]
MSDKSAVSGNLYASIPANLDNELFELIINNENIKIERIISKGHKSPETGWYDQVHNEWVMLLKGTAIVTFEDRELTMSPGAYVNIPAHTRHKVNCTNPEEETIWLAIHY